MKFLPSVPEVAKEALVVVGGAVLAAYIMGQFPSVKAWIKKQWS